MRQWYPRQGLRECAELPLAGGPPISPNEEDGGVHKRRRAKDVAMKASPDGRGFGDLMFLVVLEDSRVPLRSGIGLREPIRK